jgi:hypothetical protein
VVAVVAVAVEVVVEVVVVAVVAVAVVAVAVVEHSPHMAGQAARTNLPCSPAAAQSPRPKMPSPHTSSSRNPKQSPRA